MKNIIIQDRDSRHEIIETHATGHVKIAKYTRSASKQAVGDISIEHSHIYNDGECVTSSLVLDGAFLNADQFDRLIEILTRIREQIV